MDAGIDRLEEKLTLDLGRKLSIFLLYFIMIPLIFVLVESESVWIKIMPYLMIFGIYYFYFQAFFTSVTINDSIIKISFLFSKKEIIFDEVNKIELTLIRLSPIIAKFKISLSTGNKIKYRIIVNHPYSTEELFNKVNYYFGLPEKLTRDEYLWDYQEDEGEKSDE